MGSSMHKMLGYGVTGLEVDDRGRIADPRVNTDSILLDGEREGEATVLAYVSHIVGPGGDVERALRGWQWETVNPNSLDPFEAVEDFHETGLRGTLLLRPVGYSDLCRRNDLIDGVQERLAHPGPRADRLDVLGEGFYPYGNLYMDALTGVQLRWDDIADWVRAKNGWQGMDPDREALLLCRHHWWEPMTSDALRERVVPMPPSEIFDLARFGELFADESLLLALRPMLATFWR